MGKRTGAARRVRHSKAYWRKGVDTGAEDAELERKRRDERLGIEPNDDSLFAVDTAGDHGDEEMEGLDLEIKQEAPADFEAMLLAKPKQRTTRADMQLKDELILSARTKVPALQPRPVGAVKQTRRALKRDFQEMRQGERGLADKQRKQKTKPKKAGPLHVRKDIWATEPTPMDDMTLRRKRVTENLRTRAKPQHPQKKTGLPAVVNVDHPGTSYNPTYDDHQDLLRKAVHAEEAKYDAEMAMEAALFVEKSELATEADRRREERMGLEDDDGVPTVHTADDNDSAGKTPATRPKPKTKKQRRREAEQKRRAKVAADAKAANAQSNEAFGTKRLRKMVAEELERAEALATTRAAKRATRPSRLGRNAIPETEQAVLTSAELVGSLRHLKPEVDLLHERWTSLQQRLVVAPSVRVKRPRVLRRRKAKLHESRDVATAVAHHDTVNAPNN